MTPTTMKKKKKKKKRTLFIFASVLVLMLVAIAGIALAFNLNQVRNTQRILLEEASFEEEYDLGDLFPEHIVNIGLLGFDRGWNREQRGQYLFRPDMLAVLSINFETDQIAVVRIPRDAYVPIYGTGGFHDKINHSYYYGYIRKSDDNHAEGILNTLKTVSNVLGGIPIHYYISVDMYSIIELVDAFGGIYYEVEETIYDQQWNVGAVLVPAGPQIMDGKTYLRYLQFRDDQSNQDYGRIDRQMNLLKQTFLYLRDKGRITDIPAIYRIYKDYVETNLSYKQIVALAYYGRDFNAADENLRFHTVVGDGQKMDGIWYQVLNQRERIRIIKEIFGIDAAPWPPIDLQDSPEYLAEQERKRLEEEGLLFDQPEVVDGHEEAAGEGDTLSPLPENPVLVPDLTGLTVEEARLMLEAIGLMVGNIQERYYNFMEKGRVVFSEPRPDYPVFRGTVINLIVSLGPELPAE